MPDRLDQGDEFEFEYYAEEIAFSSHLRQSLEQRGFTNVLVEAEPSDCYTIRMRREDGALDPAAVRQLICEVVGQIPATRKYHISWHLDQSVAVVQGVQIAVAIRVKVLQPSGASGYPRPPST